MNDWTPTDEELRDIALEIPLSVLDAIDDIEQPNPPGRTPTLLRKVVRAVWEASPGPEALKREAELEGRAGCPLEGMADPILSDQ